MVHNEAKLRDLHIYLRREYYTGPGARAASQVLETFLAEVVDNSSLCLTVVEFLLSKPIVNNPIERKLEILLANSNSAYRVSSNGRRLEMRVTPEVVLAAEATINEAAVIGSAGQHLANAWNAAYGRLPDSTKAYSEAIKAVEAAAAPVLTPSDQKATLGTLRGHLRANISDWKLAIDNGGQQGIQVLLDAISLLWDNQTSRHGGINPTRPETPEAGRAAVDTAVMIVQWFISGAVQKR